MDQSAEQLQKRLEKLETLLEVNREVALDLDLDMLLKQVAKQATGVLDADRSSLYVVDQEKGELWTRVAQGVEEIRMPLGRGIAGKVAETGEKLNVEDAYQMPEFDHSWDQKHGYVTRSMLCTPLKGRNGEVIGVFAVLNKHSGVFNQEDEELLMAMGAGIAVSLENALLVDELRQANRQIAETYEEMLQAEKLSMLGLLAGMVAHDIQNPLAVIMGHAEVLSRKFPDDAVVEKSSTTIIEQVERAADLVQSVQNFSRKDTEAFGEVDLHGVLREALMLTERLLVKSDIRVDRDYSPDLPAAWGSANRLEQVFMNLIQNAVQAMAGGGRLRVATRYRTPTSLGPNWVEVEVSDTGGGIPEQEEKRIFEAFFTTKPEGKGTGLGLAICRRIIDAHQGEIELKNRPEEGATFLIRIPPAGSVGREGAQSA